MSNSKHRAVLSEGVLEELRASAVSKGFTNSSAKAAGKSRAETLLETYLRSSRSSSEGKLEGAKLVGLVELSSKPKDKTLL